MERQRGSTGVTHSALWLVGGQLRRRAVKVGCRVGGGKGGSLNAAWGCWNEALARLNTAALLKRLRGGG